MFRAFDLIGLFVGRWSGFVRRSGLYAWFDRTLGFNEEARDTAKVVEVVTS